MENFQMPTEEFSFVTLRDLFEHGKLRDNLDAKAYIDKYFFIGKGNKYIFWTENRFEMYDKITFTDMYLNRFPKKIKQYFLCEKVDIRKVTVDFTAGKIFSKGPIHYINMVHPLGIAILNHIERIKVSECLDSIYDHILNVLCSGNKEMYEWVLNFLACTFANRKLRKALYFQSDERTGKGVVIKLILLGILGKRMYTTNSTEEILKYTKAFEGRSLLNLDELPTDTSWRSLSDSLKILITEPTFNCRTMFSNAYEQSNTFNIIITSNNDAVLMTQTNKERYVMPKVSEKRKGDTAYFAKLVKNIKTEGVLEWFYLDMIERYKTLENWNEDVVPFSEVKQSKIIEGLPPFIKYIKEEYVLASKNINSRTDQFLNNYQHNSRDNSSKQKLGRLLATLDIKPIKLSNNMGYKYHKCSEDLFKIYSDKGWIDEENDVINKYNNDFDKFDNLDEKDELEKKVIELQSEITDLKEKLRYESNKIKKPMQLTVINNKFELIEQEKYKVKQFDFIYNKILCDMFLKRLKTCKNNSLNKSNTSLNKSNRELKKQIDYLRENKPVKVEKSLDDKQDYFDFIDGFED